MSEQNKQPLDAAVEETTDLANQAIEQTRAEIARSQALSQAEADLAQSIERIIDEHDGPAHEQGCRRSDVFTLGKKKALSRDEEAL